jgi:phosphoribosylglycinamide formyltransferase-1
VTPRKRVAILISGRGSNMGALIEAAQDPDYPAEVVGVLSNRAAAPGLETATAAGISVRALAQSSFPDRAAMDAAITAQLEAWDTEIVCLAGFMRILTPDFVDRWLGRMINVHPSLLPEFKGLDPHAQALAAGVAEHGCSVHFVTHGMDEGPVILQARVPVLPDDTTDSLAARVLIEEHRLYPRALAMVARGEVRFPGPGHHGN